MRKSMLMIVSAAAIATAIPQCASAAPTINGAALKAAAEAASPVQSAHYYGYRRYYGGYGYRGYGYRGYGYRGYGYGY
jgi:hypothetical protein